MIPTVDSVVEMSPGIVLASLTVMGPQGPYKHAYIFPKDILEWRAAEYDLDPTDIDTLHDMIFYEVFATDPPLDFGHPNRKADRLDKMSKADKATITKPAKDQLVALLQIDPDSINAKAQLLVMKQGKTENNPRDTALLHKLTMEHRASQAQMRQGGSS